MYYEWTPSLSVNIPSIDRQHQVLIGYINDLHDAESTEKALSISAGILKKLVNYTVVHFLYEEMLFATYNYEEETEHKASHQKFIDTISDFQKRCEQGDSTVPAQLLDMLKSWLNHHILKDDMAYSSYLLEQGVE